MTDYIKIWEFDKAPQDLQALSRNGGDQDYLAVVPASMFIPFFLESSHFGCCTVERHVLESGETVLIGCHA